MSPICARSAACGKRACARAELERLSPQSPQQPPVVTNPGVFRRRLAQRVEPAHSCCLATRGAQRGRRGTCLRRRRAASTAGREGLRTSEPRHGTAKRGVACLSAGLRRGRNRGHLRGRRNGAQGTAVRCRGEAISSRGNLDSCKHQRTNREPRERGRVAFSVRVSGKPYGEASDDRPRDRARDVE